MTDVVNDSNTDGITAGRRAEFFVRTPEWIVVSGLSPQAQCLYTALLAHVNHSREDGLAWPGMDALAQLLGYGRRQSLRRYIAELVELGALEVEREQHSMRRRNLYYVHETPPAGYAGCLTMKAFYAKRKAENPTSAPTCAAATIGRAPAATLATPLAATMNQTNPTRPFDPDEVTPSDAVPSIGQLASTNPQRKIITRPRFWRLTDGQATQYLVSAALSSIKKAGLVPHPEAGDAMGRTLKKRKEEGATREQLVDEVRAWVKVAGTTDKNGWLGSPRRSEAA